MSSSGSLLSWSLRDWHHANEVVSAILSLAFNALLSSLLIREKDETIKPYSRVLLQNCLVDVVYTFICLLVETCVEVDKGHYILIVNGCLRFLPLQWHYALSIVHLTSVALTVLIVPVEFVFRYLIVCKSVTLSTKQIYYMGAVALFICTFCSSFAGFAFTLDSEAGGGYDHHAVDLIWPRDGNEAMVVLWASTKDPLFLTHIALTMFAEGVAYAVMIVTSIATYREIRKKKSRMTQKTLYAQRQMNRILITEASSVFVVGILPVICIFTMLFLEVSAVGYGTVLTMIHVWVPLLNPLTTLLLVRPYRRAIFGRLRSCRGRNSVHITYSPRRNEVYDIDSTVKQSKA
ncbi:7TM GPCR protein [Aphelenchoides avenae]|nr:7TM GPCR protein [Aphelenchus avenae]